MASRMIVNKYETYKNLKENKIEEGEKKELIRRDNYEKDLESLERREKENTAIMWGFVLGFLLFIIIFIFIIIFTI